MQYRTLGLTGMKVSHLCLGSMMLGAWGNPDHHEGERIIHAALDAGVNFVDTADVYSAGESEEIVGRALRGRRDDVVLATKFHGSMGDDRNAGGNSRRWVMKAVEGSLRRLWQLDLDIRTASGAGVVPVRNPVRRARTAREWRRTAAQPWGLPPMVLVASATAHATR